MDRRAWGRTQEVGPKDGNSSGGMKSVGYRGLCLYASCTSRSNLGVVVIWGLRRVIDGRIGQIDCARPW